MVSLINILTLLAVLLDLIGTIILGFLGGHCKSKCCCIYLEHEEECSHIKPKTLIQS